MSERDPGTEAGSGRHRAGASAVDAPRYAPRTVLQKISRGLGELFVTLGMVLLLLVVYELWITDIFGAQKQAAATQVLDEKWTSGGIAEVEVTRTATAPTSAGEGPASAQQQEVDPAQRTKKYDTTIGQGFAKIYIPAFGTDFVFTIIEGTNDDDLYVGPGHYEKTQYPGEPGNFAVAGHRVSKGAPFNDLDGLRSCDALVIETQDSWFVYRVLPMPEEAATWNPAAKPHCTGVDKPEGLYANVFGRTIVLPSKGDVVYPVPGAATTEVPKDAKRLITLTTCHPQFSDAERMIVHGVLTKTYAKASGFLPPELTQES